VTKTSRETWKLAAASFARRTARKATEELIRESPIRPENPKQTSLLEEPNRNLFAVMRVA
jgi:hypothetical protein